MTDAFAYSLKSGDPNSDEYFATIQTFTDQWEAFARGAVQDVVTGYQDYRRRFEKPVRSFDECAFELLALGVLMREHGFDALRLPAWCVSVLESLLKAQIRWPKLVGPIKLLRGIAGGIAGGLGKTGRFLRGNQGQRFVGSRKAIGGLVDWLRAQGQEVQAERFQGWKDYFDSLSYLEGRRVIQRCQELADHFAQTSEPILGKYTLAVEDYLEEATPEARWRYDSALITRGRVEYHLGMLGTEILNRAYRPRFLQAERRIIIAPTCLRAQPNDVCWSVQTPAGAVCKGCTPGCHVFQLTKLGEKYGVPVVVVPDDELEKVCMSSGQVGSGLGVIGLSCALTNWAAGWQAERLGLNAQGVLLDCAGCKKHWTRRGVSTDANLKKIREILSV